MYQVQWGRKGHWNRELFNERSAATEFCKKTANECDRMMKVILSEKEPDGEMHTILSMEGMK